MYLFSITVVVEIKQKDKYRSRAKMSTIDLQFVNGDIDEERFSAGA